MCITGLQLVETNICKLIRDADKIDIFYIYTEELKDKDLDEILRIKNHIKEVSPAIKEGVFNHSILDVDDVETKADELLFGMFFLFDINYKKSFEIIAERQYFDYILPRFEDHIDGFVEFEKCYKNFIEKKLEK